MKYCNITDKNDSLYWITDIPSMKTLAIDYSIDQTNLSLIAPAQSTKILPIQPVAASSKESFEIGDTNQQEAGIFITNEESFTDLTSLPPKFQDHKQSTPLPELRKKGF